MLVLLLHFLHSPFCIMTETELSQSGERPPPQDVIILHLSMHTVL